jgi:hypothetical protein
VITVAVSSGAKRDRHPEIIVVNSASSP